jgi:hypothetical protein
MSTAIRRYVPVGMLVICCIIVGLAALEVPAQTPPAFSWRMEDRFGASRADFAPVPVVTPTAEYIHSAQRLVHFDACPTASGQGAPNAAYAWRIDGLPPVQAGCRYDHTFAALGQHRVELTVTTAGAAAVTVQMIDLKDHLIVSLGDSYASGEGVPDVEGEYAISFPPCRESGTFSFRTPCVERVVRPAQWSSAVCHRSSWAGPAQAGLAIEWADPHSTVTFISLACSGASIDGGLLGPHRGQPPQVDALVRLLCPPAATCAGAAQLRRVDALVISIGGNDLKFSEIITFCATSIFECTGVHQSAQSPVAAAQQTLAAIGTRYVALFRAINERLNVAQVYLTENADATIGVNGQYCAIGGFPYGLRISSTDVAWLQQNLLTKLNDTERAVSRTLGWVFIDGIADRFHGHGYCAPDGWFVTYPESWRRQGDDEGTMHPNRQGHLVYAQRISAVVGAVLIRPSTGSGRTGMVSAVPRAGASSR